MSLQVDKVIGKTEGITGGSNLVLSDDTVELLYIGKSEGITCRFPYSFCLLSVQDAAHCL